jgi:hypothetical protein
MRYDPDKGLWLPRRERVRSGRCEIVQHALMMEGTGGAPAASDPYWSSVSMLLHMEGANNGTTFTDSKGLITLTATESIVTSTSQYKYGASSAYFPYSIGSSGLILSSSTALTLSGDFTIELWFRTPNPTTNYVIIGGNYSGGTNRSLQINQPAGKLYFYDGTTEVSTTASVTIQANTWHFLALTRSGSTMRFYFDGSKVGNDLTSSNSMDFSAGSLGRLRGNPFQQFQGYMDEVRITKGVARYTGSTLTVPTAAFPNS